MAKIRQTVGLFIFHVHLIDLMDMNKNFSQRNQTNQRLKVLTRVLKLKGVIDIYLCM